MSHETERAHHRADAPRTYGSGHTPLERLGTRRHRAAGLMTSALTPTGSTRAWRERRNWWAAQRLPVDCLAAAVETRGETEGYVSHA